MSPLGCMLPRMSTDVLWTLSDGWTDLAALITDAGEATVASTNGTTRLFRIGNDGAFHARVPLEGGHVMVGDHDWRRLETLTGGPCGLTLAGPVGSHWAKGTPIRLLLAGLWPHWASLPETRATVEAVISRTPLPRPVGHPAGVCGALYCLAR